MSEKLCMLYSKQSRLKAMINEAVTNGAEELAERLDNQLDNVNKLIDDENMYIYKMEQLKQTMYNHNDSL